MGSGLNRACLDSVIVIDYLNGVPEAGRFVPTVLAPAVSMVSWIEVLAGVRDPSAERLARGVLGAMDIVSISDEIAEEAVLIRRTRRLKLPDAIILATARHLGMPLVTRNVKDFDRADPDIVVPYEI